MKITFCFLTFFLVLGCSSDEDIPTTNPEEITHDLKINSKININEVDGITFATIAEGDKLVFEYRFKAEDEINISDDEYSERIIFEVDASLDTFSLAGDELLNANAFFDAFCFCDNRGSISINEGRITGSKIAENSWRIGIDVSFLVRERLETRSISEVFEPIVFAL